MKKNNILFKLLVLYYSTIFSNFSFFNDKKAVSPVVATALLLVVTVLAAVGFQTWFSTYSSGLQNEVESQSSSSLDTRIDKVIGETLYFRNGGNENISIDRVVIGGQDCNVSQNLSSGINNLDLGNCTNNVSESVTDVVVYTSKGVYSQDIFLDTVTSPGLDSNESTSGGSFSFDCSSLPGEWSAVPGNDNLGTDDFCVMTYEAKDDSGTATSQPSGTPWVALNQTDARAACSSLGSEYQLITDSQWVTMARNAENIGANWDSGTVGSGSMWRGHTDNSPTNALSVSNTSDYYDQTENSSPSIQKRVLELSTGDIVWDISGNVWEWTNDTIYNSSDQTLDGLLGTGSDGWYEWTSISGNDYLKPFNTTFDSTNGIGKVNVNSGSYIHAFQRGGSRGDGADAGVFALDLRRSPGTASFTDYGFRCSYSQ